MSDEMVVIDVQAHELAPASAWPEVVARFRAWQPAWRAAIEAHRAPATVRAYAGRVDRFLGWAAENPPGDDAGGTPAAVIRERARAWVKSLDCGPSGSNLALAAVRSFTFWCFEHGHLQLDPLAGIRSEPVAKGYRRDALSDADAVRLLEVCEADPTPTGRRAWAVVALMLYAGIRTVEARRARVGDLATKRNRRVLHVQGKGHREADAYVVLAPAVERALRAWLAVHPDANNLDAPLFPSLSPRSFGASMSGRAMRETLTLRMKHAGVHDRRRTVHSLRHTAVTATLVGGAELRDAQAMARHASSDMTERYAHDLKRLDDPAELRIAYGAPGEAVR